MRCNAGSNVTTPSITISCPYPSLPLGDNISGHIVSHLQTPSSNMCQIPLKEGFKFPAPVVDSHETDVDKGEITSRDKNSLAATAKAQSFLLMGIVEEYRGNAKFKTC